MRTLTIHAALGELKLLDKKIETKISDSNFIGIKKNSSEKVFESLDTVDDFKKNASASFQSITDLMALRDEIKSKIVVSNATTTLQVGNKVMTVAEAIERKNSIKYKEQLLGEMSFQYREVIMSEKNKNEKVEEKLDNQISMLIGSSKESNKSQSEDIVVFSKSFREKNLWTIIDPLSIKKEIDKLQEEINDFKNNVDVALSVSNATTTIEVEK